MPYAMQIARAGGPEVFERVDVARPVPGPGQLLLRVAAAGLNFIETYQRSGVYAVDYPLVPGVEAAGTVEEVGAGVTGFAPGDRMATTEGTGSYAEYMVLDAAKAPRPGLQRGPRPRPRHAGPLEQAGEAHTAMESRETTGKILLLPAAADGLA